MPAGGQAASYSQALSKFIFFIYKTIHAGFFFVLLICISFTVYKVRKPADFDCQVSPAKFN
jgi:hypothetical protein